MNFLQETIEAIQKSGHSPDQIVFIGSELSGHQCSWAEFQALADVEYDEGPTGAVSVASDLIIVFGDGQKLWREEFDSAEWWVYQTPFKVPASSRQIKRLISPKLGLFELHEFNP